MERALLYNFLRVLCTVTAITLAFNNNNNNINDNKRSMINIIIINIYNNDYMIYIYMTNMI